MELEGAVVDERILPFEVAPEVADLAVHGVGRCQRCSEHPLRAGGSHRTC